MNVLIELAAHHGWVTHRERDGGPIIALGTTARASRSSPAASSSSPARPLADVHQICAEFRGHLRELGPSPRGSASSGSASASIRSPRASSLHWSRSSATRSCASTCRRAGRYGVDMMLRTSTVQANYDYSQRSRRDAQDARLAHARAAHDGACSRTARWSRASRFGGVSDPRPRCGSTSTPIAPASSRAVEEERALRRLRRVGARRADVHLQARRDDDRQHRADVSAASGRAASRATGRRRAIGRRTSTRSSPRSASRRRSRSAAPTRRAPKHGVRAPRAVPGILYDDARARRGRGAHGDWTYDEVNALAPAHLARRARHAVPRRARSRRSRRRCSRSPRAASRGVHARTPRARTSGAPRAPRAPRLARPDAPPTSSLERNRAPVRDREREARRARTELCSRSP